MYVHVCVSYTVTIYVLVRARGLCLTQLIVNSNGYVYHPILIWYI